MEFIVVFGLLTILFFFFCYRRIHLPLWSILILSFTIRLFLVFFFPQSFSTDVYSFVWVGEVLLQKIPTYWSMYFPFIYYLGALSVFAGKIIPSVIFLKIIFGVFDVGVTYFLYKLSKDHLPALLYALNPVILIIVFIHGQLDSLPIFFLLWSIFAVTHKKETLASLLLGIAVAIKPWPLIFAPVFFRKSKHPFVYLWVGIIPLVTVVIHSLITHIPMIDIITPIKNYRGIYTVWGIGNIMATLFPSFWDEWIKLFRRIFLVSYGVWSLVNHKKEFVAEFFFTMLTFFVFTPLFGVQWVAWIVPFLILLRPKRWKTVYILMTVYVSVAFFTDIYSIPDWYVPWRIPVADMVGLVTWLSVIRLFFSYRKEFLKSPSQ